MLHDYHTYECFSQSQEDGFGIVAPIETNSSTPEATVVPHSTPQALVPTKASASTSTSAIMLAVTSESVELLALASTRPEI